MNSFLALWEIICSLGNYSLERLQRKQPDKVVAACIAGSMLGTWIGLVAGTISAFEDWSEAPGAFLFCYPTIAITVGSFIAGLVSLIKTSEDSIREKFFILTFTIGGTIGFLIGQLIIFDMVCS